jgi:hypothetical protein
LGKREKRRGRETAPRKFEKLAKNTASPVPNKGWSTEASMVVEPNPSTTSKKATRSAIQLSGLLQRRSVATVTHKNAEMIRRATNRMA